MRGRALVAVAVFAAAAATAALSHAGPAVPPCVGCATGYGYSVASVKIEHHRIRILVRGPGSHVNVRIQVGRYRGDRFVNRRSYYRRIRPNRIVMVAGISVPDRAAVRVSITEPGVQLRAVDILGAVAAAG
jgi:hypothetical protein